MSYQLDLDKELSSEELVNKYRLPEKKYCYLIQYMDEPYSLIPNTGYRDAIVWFMGIFKGIYLEKTGKRLNRWIRKRIIQVFTWHEYEDTDEGAIIDLVHYYNLFEEEGMEKEAGEVFNIEQFVGLFQKYLDKIEESLDSVISLFGDIVDYDRDDIIRKYEKGEVGNIKDVMIEAGFSLEKIEATTMFLSGIDDLLYELVTYKNDAQEIEIEQYLWDYQGEYEERTGDNPDKDIWEKATELIVYYRKEYHRPIALYHKIINYHDYDVKFLIQRIEGSDSAVFDKKSLDALYKETMRDIKNGVYDDDFFR